VGFRFFTLEQATKLNLTGWVRNNYDGSVEIVVQGNEEKLDMFIDAVENGNELSIIECIDIREEATTEELTSFEIKY